MEQQKTEKLTELFQRASGKPPYFIHKASIHLENSNSSTVDIKTSKPYETAKWLNYILMNNDSLLFKRETVMGTRAPITFEMDIREHKGEQKKEYLSLGLRMRFNDMKSPSEIYFNGDIAYDGPSAKECISAFKKAGANWNAVSFRQKPQKAKLKLV